MANPNQNTDPRVNASSTSWLDNAPGGDVPFDQLFGTEPEASFSSANPSTIDPVQSTTTDVRPPETTSNGLEFHEIRTSTGSVYKTLDAVTKGIEEKDTLIQQLRDRFRAVTGADPLRPQEQPPQPQSGNYLSNPARFAEDLASAAKEGNAAKYRDTMVGLMEEYFGPAKPLIQEFARSRANEQVRNEFSDFDKFRTSDDFGKVLARNPALGNAIQAAETNIGFSHQLPELYRLAYESFTARRLPELVQAAQQTAASPTQSVRPTVQSNSLTPANPVTQRNDQEMLRTTEGRKELISRFRAMGLEDHSW